MPVRIESGRDRIGHADIIKLQASAYLFQVKYDRVFRSGFNNISALLIGGSLNCHAGKEIHQIGTVLFCRRIRYIDLKLYAITHGDGQSFFAGERSKACKQPVSVRLLLDLQ